MSGQVIFRASAISELPATVLSLLPDAHSKKVFLVSGGSFTDSFAEELQKQGISLDSFDEFSSNPTYDDILAGLDAFKASQADLLISVGGRSAIDLAKCILLFSSVPDEHFQIDAQGDDESSAEKDKAEPTYLTAEYSSSSIPHLAIPTTAGSGSEATTFSIVHMKKPYVVDSSHAIPEYVALVPEFLHGLPSYQRKTAILDALCQSIESYWSVKSTDESKAYAKEAIKLILNNYQDYLASDDGGAAEVMLEAAHLAGKAINIAGVTAASAMSYQMTSLYGIAHGHALALCMPKVWRYMIGHLERCSDERGTDYLGEMFAELDELFGFNEHNQTIEWLEALVRDFDMLPPKSKSAADMGKLRRSVTVAQLANNPIKLTKKMVTFLYRQIIPSLAKHRKKVSPARKAIQRLKKVKEVARRISSVLYRRAKFDLDDTLVFFVSNQGKDYSGQYRTLFEQAHADERFNQLHYVWGFKKKSVTNYRFLERKGSTRVASRNSRRFINVISQARFLCFDHYLPYGVKLRKNQILIPPDTDIDTFFE
ncbi:MAG: iron-containing alcohol dehydrogenase, partial [Coriobacteriia bacterium]|nr:iron-containing alcohol dehydrogenase [Coriobacteriia bacterium]